jgi:hypothetical protein
LIWLIFHFRQRKDYCTGTNKAQAGPNLDAGAVDLPPHICVVGRRLCVERRGKQHYHRGGKHGLHVESTFPI